MTDIVFDVAESEAGVRIDRLIAAHGDNVSRSLVQRLISDGDVRIDGVPASKASQTLEAGQSVRVHVRERQPETELVAEPMDLSVIYEDEHLAVIDKPAGLVVHPAPGHWHGTLVHGLLARFGDRLSARATGARPGIVHRLDRGTSGVIVVALSDSAHADLTRQFAERTVGKEYLAVVYGGYPESRGTIDAAIGRDRTDRKKMSTHAATSRAAVTDWIVDERFAGVTAVRALPRTGRTHQIRVHLALAGHPIVGDDVYAGRQWKGLTSAPIRAAVRKMQRPALHALRLEFDHPIDGRRIACTAPVAADIEALLGILRSASAAS